MAQLQVIIITCYCCYKVDVQYLTFFGWHKLNERDGYLNLLYLILRTCFWYVEL